MKFICLVYHNEDNLEEITDADFSQMFKACDDWVGELQAKDCHVFSAGLQSTRTAVTVRKRNGERIVTDGPFAETKEWLGGFTVIEADSMNDAIEEASKLASASRSTVEVRPVMDARSELTDPVDKRVAAIRRHMNL